VDRVSVVGRNVPVDLVELLGTAEEIPAAARDLARRYEEAFTLYLSRRFPEAARLLEEITELHGDDSPTRRLLERCRQFEATPPADDWDGSHPLKEK
jgi:adenylate cyclase